jgi:hypothetical protein
MADSFSNQTKDNRTVTGSVTGRSIAAWGAPAGLDLTYVAAITLFTVDSCRCGRV